MKKIFLLIMFALSFHSYSGCDESWEKADYEQNIHSYKVINKLFFIQRQMKTQEIISFF